MHGDVGRPARVQLVVCVLRICVDEISGIDRARARHPARLEPVRQLETTDDARRGQACPERDLLVPEAGDLVEHLVVVVEGSNFVEARRKRRALDGGRLQPRFAVLVGRGDPSERVAEGRLGQDRWLHLVPVVAGRMNGAVDDDDEPPVREARLAHRRLSSGSVRTRRPFATTRAYERSEEAGAALGSIGAAVAVCTGVGDGEGVGDGGAALGGALGLGDGPIDGGRAAAVAEQAASSTQAASETKADGRNLFIRRFRAST